MNRAAAVAALYERRIHHDFHGLHDGHRPPLQKGFVLTATNPSGTAALLRGCALILAAVLLSACRTPPAPAVDLGQPEWTSHQGQAVWTTKRGARGIAGELLVATQPGGACWVQFAKPPFNICTAQRTPPYWHVEYQQGHERYAGRGHPPARLIWFQLAEAIGGGKPTADWRFTRGADDSWTLENTKSGERLEGYLAP